MKKINIILIIVMTLILSLGVSGLSYKPDNDLFNEYNGKIVNWEHITNLNTKQEFMLSITSDVNEKLNASVYLSEYKDINGIAKDYNLLNSNNFKAELVNEIITYEYFNLWCTNSLLSNCVRSDSPITTNESTFNVYGGQEVEEIITYEYIELPKTNYQISTISRNIKYDLNEIQLIKNKETKIKVTFENNFNDGDYGVFSLMVDGVEFWDKTHSSDFLLSNTVLYYSFDDDDLSGSNPLDLSPNNYDGTTVSITTGQNGIINESFLWSNDDKRVYTPLTSTMNLNGDVNKTFNVWVNASSLPTSNDARIFGNDNAGGSLNYHLNYRDAGSEDCFAFWTAVETTQNCIITSPSINTWYMLTVVMDAENDEYRLYSNGVNTLNVSYSGSMAIDNDYIYLGENTGTPSRDWEGLIDEFSIYGQALNDSDILLLYNEGLSYQYPFPIETVFGNTSLYYYNDDLNDTTLNSQSFSTIYSLSRDFISNYHLDIFIPITAEKISVPLTTDVYMRTLVDGTPQDTHRIISLEDVGDIINSVYHASVDITSGNHTIDFQIRLDGTGSVDITNSNINIYTSLTKTGYLDNYNETDIDTTIINDGTYKDVSTLTINESNLNTMAFFIGTINHSSVTTKENISLRLSNNQGNYTNPIIHTLNSGLATFVISDIFKDNSTSFTLQVNGTYNVNIEGEYHVLSLVDNNDNLVQVYDNLTLDTNISDINIFDNGLFSIFSMSYYANTTSTVNLYHTLTNQNLSTTSFSKNTTEMITVGDVGVMNSLHGSKNPLNSSYLYTFDVDYYETGTDDILYFDALLFQGSILEFNLNVDGDINLTVNEVNNSYISTISGSCDSSNVINEVSINNTDFSLTGDFNNFNFNYGGSDILNLNVKVSCTDIFNNVESLDLIYNVDTTSPSCSGFDNEILLYNYNESGYSYTWDITCNDNFNLNNISVTCTNGYNFSGNLSGVSDNFTETTLFNQSATCSLLVYDLASNNFSDSATFSVSSTEVPAETIFDVDGTLNVFTCPTNYLQFGHLLLFIGFALGIYFFGRQKLIDYKKIIFMFIGGLMMFIIPFYLIACDLWLSVFLWMISVALLLDSLTSGFKGKGEN